MSCRLYALLVSMVVMFYGSSLAQNTLPLIAPPKQPVIGRYIQQSCDSADMRLRHIGHNALEGDLTLTTKAQLKPLTLFGPFVAVLSDADTLVFAGETDLGETQHAQLILRYHPAEKRFSALVISEGREFHLSLSYRGGEGLGESLVRERRPPPPAPSPSLTPPDPNSLTGTWTGNGLQLTIQETDETLTVLQYAANGELLYTLSAPRRSSPNYTLSRAGGYLQLYIDPANPQELLANDSGVITPLRRLAAETQQIPAEADVPLDSANVPLGNGDFSHLQQALNDDGTRSSPLRYHLQDNPQYTFASQVTPHQKRISDLAFSPDGQYVASASEDTTIHLRHLCLFDRDSASITLRGHSEWVNSIAFHPTLAHLASGSDDASVRIWNLQTGDLAAPVMNGHSRWVGSVSYSPDGQILVSAGGDGTIIMWNTQPYQLWHTLPQEHARWARATFSPKGNLLASGAGDGTLYLWNSQTWALQSTGQRHQGGILDLNYSSDGAFLATVGVDTSVRLWDVQRPDNLAQTHLWLDHLDWSVASAFSPDGRLLASVSRDGTLKLRDVLTKELLQDLSFEARMLAVAFSPDGQYLAVGGMDNTVTLLKRAPDITVGVMTGHVPQAQNVP